MKTLITLAGTYVCESPYHKRKMLPFNIETDGYVSTVEYKGWTAYLVKQYYTLETILLLIESGVIKEGKAEFPKRIKQIR